MARPSKEDLVAAIRNAVHASDGKWITRQEFLARSGMKLTDILRYFPSWSEAVAEAGFDIQSPTQKIDPEALLADWGELVRSLRRIPTRNQYKIQGTYSAGVFETNFGPWSGLPARFRDFAKDKPEWADVVALLPIDSPAAAKLSRPEEGRPDTVLSRARHAKLTDRPIYGDPIDFRGLRHEPVNEDGVVFLFGVIARELGYLVEAVQAGFPDCEAKRQIGPGKWQRVRIEFEFESVNFRDHGHSPSGCDMIVCWRHNWPDVPGSVEVLELREIIKTLARSEE